MSEALFIWLTFVYMAFVAVADNEIRYLKRLNAIKERRIADLEKSNKEYLDKWREAINTAYQAVAEQDYYHNLASARASPFSDKDLKHLISLCHPDKHDNSELATEMTKKLLKLKSIT